ncbi:hypothetical protein FVE67_06100 [Thermosulfurimonas marina]|uniref:Metallo-beta-lactamase domain-containing protein n=1 Tax=Thermosulfurimonas marina TaxID=2047767 RepID=A0A6H1WT89_9BACT|nr:MBL fold metallo-hydrolase [Thermosulfurimonas marina]QJA06402.1 hypothetical protein FVE67_06100 [Thermosulfurimonas marina]
MEAERPLLMEIFRWKVTRFIENRVPRIFELPVRELSPEELLEGDRVVFLGHGTVWLQVGDRALLFDPIFGPIGGVVRRRTPPPLSPEDLPRPDLVLISHAHLDHLDRASLRGLSPGFRVICGLGAGRYLEGYAVTELDWLDEVRTSGIRIVALPAQHWSQRTLFDHNRALWASYLVEIEGLRVFYGGDTGYFEGFREIGEEYGPFDLAFLPCGAYEPRELMAPFHLNPEEAVRAARDLRARLALPIHWGAYALGDEPPEAPPRLFAEEARKEGLTARVLFPGEILRL